MSFRIHTTNLVGTGRATRAVGVLAALGLLLAVAVPAHAVLVTDVRVGLHKTFTRVVLETDTPARYRITRTPGGEVQVQLSAEATPRRVTSRSDLLSEVVLAPGRQGTTARLRLRGQDVKINELILMNPPRIVLDLRGTGAPIGVAKTTPAPAPAPAVKPTPKPAPKPVAKTTPKPAPTPIAKATPGPKTQISERALDASRKTTGDLIREATEKGQIDTKAAAAAAREKADALAKAGARAADEADKLGTAADQAKTAAGDAASKGADALAKAGDAASQQASDLTGKAGDLAGSAGQMAQGAADRTAGIAGSAKDQAAAAAAAARQKTQAAADRAARMAEATRQKAGQKAGDLARSAKGAADAATPDSSPLPAFLRDPVVLGGVGVAFALALGIFLHQRRSGREDDYLSPAAADEPFSIDETAIDETQEADEPRHGLGGAAAVATAATAAATGAAYHRPDDEDASDDDDEFGHETSVQDEEAPAVDTGMDTSMDSGFGTMPTPGGANSDVMSMFQELERRVTMLEKRLEETTEAKERLERQVAAQTEELRVQRSAIARTQRALRSIARPDEEATEPVPKG